MCCQPHFMQSGCSGAIGQHKMKSVVLLQTFLFLSYWSFCLFDFCLAGVCLFVCLVCFGSLVCFVKKRKSWVGREVGGSGEEKNMIKMYKKLIKSEKLLWLRTIFLFTCQGASVITFHNSSMNESQIINVSGSLLYTFLLACAQHSGKYSVIGKVSSLVALCCFNVMLRLQARACLPLT